jgi:Reverse transcriptase (RNA-dependent DNA polymerase)/gag-polypeptide of LTR copia-type/GAG-pre-integrase domain
MADEISNKLDDDLSSIKPLFQKLTGADNYRYWEGQMRSTLVIYRVWEVVSGESPKPPFPIPEPNLIMEEFLELGGSQEDWIRYKISNARYQRWLKLDTRAAILIRTHLNETHLGKVQGQTSSKGMWDLLAKDLQTNTMAPLLHVHDKIQAVKIDDFKTPTEYVAKMESLLEEQDRLGFGLDDYTKILHLIDGLSYRYRELVDRFKNYTKDQWSLTAIKNAIVSFTVPSAKPTAAANTVTHYSSKNNKRKRGQNASQRQESKPRHCPHCNKDTHTGDDCWIKHPEKRPAKRAKTLSKPAEEANTAKTKETALRTRISPRIYEKEDLPGTTWLVDSGATKHFCRHKNAFKDLSPYVTTIEVANGDLLESEGIGTVDLPVVQSNGKVTLLRLKEVIYAPKLNANLLSADQLNKDNIGLTLLPHGSEIVDGTTRKHLGAICRLNNLYIVNTRLEGGTEHTHLVTDMKPKSIRLWHRRLGHLGLQNIKRLQSLVKGLKISEDKTDKDQEFVCDHCQKARHARHPFASHGIRTRSPFEIVYSDICGPFPESHDGCKYFVTFTDDFTRFSWVFRLKKRDDIYNTYDKFKTMLKTQFDRVIKHFISDNAGEYAKLQETLEKDGTIWEPTIAYTPQQNGVSERLNRTLLTKLRAMLFESGLPKELWTELLDTANYLKNRAPTKLLPETPYEKLYGTQPDVSHLRAVGTIGWAMIPSDKHLGKLDERSKQCKLLGYEGNSQFILYEQESGRVIWSRDVVFDENPASGGDDNEVEDHVQLPETENDLDVFRTRLEKSEIEHAEADDSHSLETSQKRDSNTSQKRAEMHKSSTSPQENPKLEVTASRYGRQRFPSRRLQEAEAAMAARHGPKDPSWDEVMSSPDRPDWMRSIHEEYNSHQENHTWDLVSIDEVPKEHNILDGKWVFRLKSDGRKKARWVARGFQQKYGIDYHETFAAVARNTSYRIILALSALLGLEVFQFDIKTAFLNGSLEEVIYMEQPHGFERPGYVCRLLKSLYGLKQAPRIWAKKLKTSLERLGFKQLQSEHCVYVKKTPTDLVLIGIYVDDILVAAKTAEEVTQVKDLLGIEYKVTDLGVAHRYLGIEIEQSHDKTIVLHQSSYVEELLQRFGMEHCSPKATPLPTNWKLDPDAAGPLLCDAEKSRYQSAVGGIMFAMTQTRPDIAFAASILSRFLSKPQEAHNKALQHCFRYLRGSTKLGIQYSASSDPELKIKGFTDADHSGTIVTEGRRSTSGYIFSINGCPISWSSNRQTTVATSSSEAEYIGQFNAGTEAMWLKKFLDELDLPNLSTTPVTILGDNQAAITLSKDPISHSKAKHMDIKYHWQREKVERNEIKFEYVPSHENVADILTKPLPREQFLYLRNRIMTEVRA